MVYFHYLTVRGKISMERKEPSTFEVVHIGAELTLFKGAICERAEILRAVLAPINFKVAPVFSNSPFTWSNLAPTTGSIQPQNWCQKQPHFNGAELTLSECQTGLTRFGPIFGAKSTLLILQCTVTRRL